VCCSLLQCVAVCCSVLHCVAVCCSVLKCVAMCCSVLQCVAGCCSVLQCINVCWSVLKCAAVCCNVFQCVTACCNLLQCVAVYCSVVHCAAVRWSVLQCVAVCWARVSKPTGIRTSYVRLEIAHASITHTHQHEAESRLHTRLFDHTNITLLYLPRTELTNSTRAYEAPSFTSKNLTLSLSLKPHTTPFPSSSVSFVPSLRDYIFWLRSLCLSFSVTLGVSLSGTRRRALSLHPFLHAEPPQVRLLTISLSCFLFPFRFRSLSLSLSLSLFLPCSRSPLLCLSLSLARVCSLYPLAYRVSSSSCLHCLWHDSCTRDMTHSHVTWIVHMTHCIPSLLEFAPILSVSHVTWWLPCDMRYSCVTWLIHMTHCIQVSSSSHPHYFCDRIHSCVTWLFKRDVTHSYDWLHTGFPRVRVHIVWTGCAWLHMTMVTAVSFCDMTHLYVTWLNHI